MPELTELTETNPMLQEVNRGLMVHWINAELAARAGHDVTFLVPDALWTEREGVRFVGLPRHPHEAIRGGDATYNADALRRLLLGEQGAYRDAVLFNAAGALIVADHVAGWPDALAQAAEAIDKGAANALLQRWIAWK